MDVCPACEADVIGAAYRRWMEVGDRVAFEGRDGVILIARTYGVVFGVLVAVWGTGEWADAQSVTLYPSISADGTLMDSNLIDGIEAADTANWAFNELSQFAGAIALVAPADIGDLGFERRVFWEYDLRAIAFAAPVIARLDYRLRGAPVWPAPPVDVQIYSYQADLQANLSDFNVTPATLLESVTVMPNLPPGSGISTGSVDVSDVVSRALVNGDLAIGVRFQIDPFTLNPQNQAFIDAEDADRDTKPTIIIENAVPFDTDADSDVDNIDYGTFHACIGGPTTSVTFNCRNLDGNYDMHVDLRDFASLQHFFTGQGP